MASSVITLNDEDLKVIHDQDASIQIYNLPANGTTNILKYNAVNNRPTVTVTRPNETENHHHHNNNNNNNNPSDSSKHSETDHASTAFYMHKMFVHRELRAAFTAIIIVCAFIASWCPFFAMYMAVGVCGHDCAPPIFLQTAFIWLGYCNSGVNPVLYTIFNRDFRSALRQLMHFRKQ